MSDKQTILDFEDPFSSNKDELNFQDIPHEPVVKSSKDGEKAQTHVFTNFPNPEDTDEDDQAKLLNEKEKEASFWSFKYYQNFFDIDARQVLQRIVFSMYPNPNIIYLKSHIKSKPDYYGPFWICTTLIISIAISGNLANYFSSLSSGKFVWHYDFHKVTIATAVIYAYWLIMPSIIFGILWCRKNQRGLMYSELICLFGYSLAIYIPISILWLVPFTWLRWILVTLGMFLSGCVLIINLFPAIRDENKQIAVFSSIFIFIMHGLLAVAFMLYFFSDIRSTPIASTTTQPYFSTLNATFSSTKKI